VTAKPKRARLAALPRRSHNRIISLNTLFRKNEIRHEFFMNGLNE